VPPLVSAIIPTYNYARFLPRAIESVLAQSYAPLECLVVDDGSTDDTPGVLERYRGRIRSVRQEHRSPAAARNRGLRETTGELVAFLDADDWWDPPKIERQVEYLTRHPEVAAAGCGVRVVGAEGEPLHTSMEPEPSTSCKENLRAIATRRLWVGGSMSGAVVRRRVLEEVGGLDEALTASEDRDLWLRIAAAYPIANLQEVLATLCWHGTGFARNAALVERNSLKIYEKVVAAWPDAIDGRTRRHWRANILADAAGEYADAGDLRKARRKYLESLLLWPASARRWKQAVAVWLRALRPGSGTALAGEAR
jgi:glycosyltransferase involved in cell wall biosynthesis